MAIDSHTNDKLGFMNVSDNQFVYFKASIYYAICFCNPRIFQSFDIDLPKIAGSDHDRRKYWRIERLTNLFVWIQKGVSSYTLTMDRVIVRSMVNSLLALNRWDITKTHMKMSSPIEIPIRAKSVVHIWSLLLNPSKIDQIRNKEHVSNTTTRGHRKMRHLNLKDTYCVIIIVLATRQAVTHF